MTRGQCCHMQLCPNCSSSTPLLYPQGQSYSAHIQPIHITTMGINIRVEAIYPATQTEISPQSQQHHPIFNGVHICPSRNADIISSQKHQDNGQVASDAEYTPCTIGHDDETKVNHKYNQLPCPRDIPVLTSKAESPAAEELKNNIPFAPTHSDTVPSISEMGTSTASNNSDYKTYSAQTKFLHPNTGDTIISQSQSPPSTNFALSKQMLQLRRADVSLESGQNDNGQQRSAAHSESMVEGERKLRRRGKLIKFSLATLGNLLAIPGMISAIISNDMQLT
ncbi:hypothetical protein M422DRAFT_49213 [Sphaerobolus stellatus SS14]|uniref:Uncharacterized protein n=1 Tax=Sphaerobolus stellatus (strain SS14) TaxID=990650 RepID=A0A0C9UAU6_SPHS4|nr:hypothetical protein M422DRAFT_49213 [Sphaerobolus stellatus SS14]